MVILQRFACFLGFDQNYNEKSRRKKLRENDSFSENYYSRVGTTAVRIIHPGGCEEWHHDEIFAQKLMESYPGLCVARPEVFKNPHISVLSGEEKLLFGNKYYLVPFSTVNKLKRRHEKKSNLLVENKSLGDFGDGSSDDSFCSANDFYVYGNENWGKCEIEKNKDSGGKQVFMPPIQKPKMWRELGWEPSLDSIQEISP